MCIATVALAGVATVLAPAHATLGTLTMFAGLALCAVLGVRTQFALGSTGMVISGESTIVLATIVVEPRLGVAVALAAALTRSAPSGSVRLIAGAQTVLPAAAAALVARVCGLPHVAPGTFAVSSLLTVLTLISVNILMVVAYEMYVWREPARGMLSGLAGTVIASTIVTLPIVLAAAWVITEMGAAGALLLFVPLMATQYFHGLYQRKAELTDELADKAQILARTNLQFAAAMVKALDARDAYTAGHSAAVAVYTRDIAREMGFDDETVRVAHLAGLLHDIGKIGVPGRVLNKTAPLDDDEYEIMKSHAAMGADILSEVDLYADIAILVRYHHERIDGRGYPDGIGGDAIPAISRMISVADTYSAMTTDRPYRDGMPTEKAMGILAECRGTQLDADFTNAFLRILVVADEAYQRGKQTDFEVEVAKHQALSEVEAEAIRVRDAAPQPVTAATSSTESPLLDADIDGETIAVPLEREAA